MKTATARNPLVPARSDDPALPRRGTFFFAVAIAALSWIGLASEAFVASKIARQGRHHPALATFVFLRFFTNLTSIGVAILMSATAHRIARRRALPPAPLYAASLVYILVVSTTYEFLLRRLWTPRGWSLVRDALMHDVIPLLTLGFWLACAPKRPLRWLDPLRWLSYPAAYIALVLAAGRAGYGYPYAFIDVDQIGAKRVARVVCAFTAAFGGLGLALVAVARLPAFTRDTGRRA